MFPSAISPRRVSASRFQIGATENTKIPMLTYLSEINTSVAHVRQWIFSHTHKHGKRNRKANTTAFFFLFFLNRWHCSASRQDQRR